MRPGRRRVRCHGRGSRRSTQRGCRQRDEIPQRRSQAAEVGVGVDVDSGRRRHGRDCFPKLEEELLGIDESDSPAVPLR